jgi:dienelactone hydrolase
MIVRGRHIGFPTDATPAAIATLYYPADAARIDEARLTGDVPPVAGEPRPTCIIVPGVNVAPDSYRWLAVRLVEAGCVAVTFAAIGDLGPAGEGITPGMDMAALAPDVAGTKCSIPTIEPLLAALTTHGAEVCDLESVSLIGHSAGGTMALHNSHTGWIPGLTHVVGFGAHTMVASMMGHGEAAVLKVPSQVPILLAAGSHDGVIAASRDRYRTDDADHDPVQRTFDEAIDRDTGDSWLIELADGHHFTICDPIDDTTGRAFLEPGRDSDQSAQRDTLAEVIAAFVTDQALDEIVLRPTISAWRRR